MPSLLLVPVEHALEGLFTGEVKDYQGDIAVPDVDRDEGAEPFLPASDTLLCQYLVWQSRTVEPRNLEGYLSAIRNLHLSLGLPWVLLRDRFMVGWVVKGGGRIGQIGLIGHLWNTAQITK